MQSAWKVFLHRTQADVLTSKFRPWQAVLIALATAAGFAAVEIALVFGVRVRLTQRSDRVIC
jgi:hypothetical protein